MIKPLLILVTTLVLTACGGGSNDTEFSLAPITPGGEGKEIVISSNNSTVTRTPEKEDTVRVTGSNNTITLTQRPKLLIITGNDNHIDTPNGGNIRNEGKGNTFGTYN